MSAPNIDEIWIVTRSAGRSERGDIVAILRTQMDAMAYLHLCLHRSARRSGGDIDFGAMDRPRILSGEGLAAQNCPYVTVNDEYWFAHRSTVMSIPGG